MPPNQEILRFRKPLAHYEHASGKSRKNLSSLADLPPYLTYFSNLGRFKCKLSDLRCELSKIYLPEVGSSDELTYFLTYLYLFCNKCAKYQLSKILVFLMHARIETRLLSSMGVWLDAEINKLVLVISSTFSVPDKQCLRFIAVWGGVTHSAKIRPRYRSSE
jgi:hypothetical protein